MKEIAQKVLAIPMNSYTYWNKYTDMKELVDYVYESGIWDSDFRDKISDLKKKNIKTLTLSEVYTYLTAIVCTERTNEGILDKLMLDGTISAVLRRYLEVVE